MDSARGLPITVGEFAKDAGEAARGVKEGQDSAAAGWRKNHCVKSEEGCIWVFEMNNKPQAWKGDTPMRACEALDFEPAACWRRLQQAKHEFFFEDLDAQMKDNHRRFLEALMGYERECFLNAHPYERSDQRVDQANGFYRRRLTTRLGVGELRLPRSRRGCFHPQVLPRYQRREPVVNEALKQVFLLGVSTRQAGRALATLVEEAVGVSPVSPVVKVVHRRVTLRQHS